MPDKFVVLDAGLPQWNGQETLSEKVDALYSHQFQLVENLRYMLRHLDLANFDEAGLKSITDPIAISLREDFNQTEITIDPSGIEAVIAGLESTLEMYVKSDAFNVAIKTLDGDITQLELDMNGINTRVENTEKNYSSLKQTVDGFETRVENVEGEFSYLEQTVNGFETRVGNLEGDYSWLEQTVNSFSTRISNAEGDISSLEQTVDGFEATVSDLESGMSTSLHLTSSGLRIGSSNGTRTTINGGYITANSITADKLKVDELTAGQIKGNEIDIWTSNDNYVGSIYTSNTSTGYGIELYSGMGGLKMTTYNGNVFIESRTGQVDQQPFMMLGWVDNDPFYKVCSLGGGALVLDANSFGDSRPSNPVYGQVYFLRA